MKTNQVAIIGKLSTLRRLEHPLNNMVTYRTRIYTLFANATIYIPQYILKGLTLSSLNNQKVAVVGHITTTLANQSFIIIDEIAIFRESNPDNI